MSKRVARKPRVFWPLFLCAFLADCTTKSMAEQNLPSEEPQPLVSDVVRLTLVYNEGTALGLPLSEPARKALGGLGILVGGVLFGWYKKTAPNSLLLPAALALILAGAMGNGWERLLSDKGVVDFIDLGWGGARFFVFNVADVAVTTGGGLLLWYLWRQGPEEGVVGVVESDLEPG